MFEKGGLVYVYLIYGIYWMVNVVTGLKGQPQAILIRGLHGINGPGKVSKQLGIDKSFYGEDLVISDRLWIENNNYLPKIMQQTRFGINYATEPWKSMPWRYIMVPSAQNF